MEQFIEFLYNTIYYEGAFDIADEYEENDEDGIDLYFAFKNKLFIRDCGDYGLKTRIICEFINAIIVFLKFYNKTIDKITKDDIYKIGLLITQAQYFNDIPEEIDEECIEDEINEANLEVNLYCGDIVGKFKYTDVIKNMNNLKIKVDNIIFNTDSVNTKDIENVYRINENGADRIEYVIMILACLKNNVPHIPCEDIKIALKD